MHSSQLKIGRPLWADIEPSLAALYVRYRAGFRRSANGRYPPWDLYGPIAVKGVVSGISLFDRPATSPRPDLILLGALRGAAVNGGRRPSRGDLPLTAASTAPD